MKLNIFVFLLICHVVLCQWGYPGPERVCSRGDSNFIAKRAKFEIKLKLDTERLSKMYVDNKIKLKNFADEILSDIRKASFLHADNPLSMKCFVELNAEVKEVRDSYGTTLIACYYGLLKKHQHMLRDYDTAMEDIDQCSYQIQSCSDTIKCTIHVYNHFDLENQFNVFARSVSKCFIRKYERSKGTLDYIKFRIGNCNPIVPPTESTPTITPLQTTVSQATAGVTIAAETTIAAKTTIAVETTTASSTVTDNMFLPVQS